jgi:signal transduction histidine kinase
MTADPLARQMLRLPEGNVVGMPVNGAFPHPRWSQTVGELLTTTEPDSSEQPQPSRAHLSLSIENGSTVEADLAALRGRDGAINGLAVTLRSSESDAERHEAIVSLANEFRTPMTAMTGYTDLLLGEQAGILTEMQQKFLERVKANVEQLNQLLNDMIQVASPDTRPMELTPQLVNLIEIIEKAIMGLAARFRERKLAIQLDLPSELAPVKADRDSLYQIMLRLLSNAVLCSKTGTQIVISAEEVTYPEGGKHLRISVTDTGGGIAPDDYPRVFRRFYRASQPLVEGMGETGVGMAMAKALVEANGGRIWVESEENVGSTFSFLLPVEA